MWSSMGTEALNIVKWLFFLGVIGKFYYFRLLSGTLNCQKTRKQSSVSVSDNITYLGSSVSSPIVSKVSPREIGLGGGAVTIEGAGFSEDVFNQFDPVLGNKVELKIFHTEKSEVINFYFEDLVCK